MDSKYKKAGVALVFLAGIGAAEATPLNCHLENCHIDQPHTHQESASATDVRISTPGAYNSYSSTIIRLPGIV